MNMSTHRSPAKTTGALRQVFVLFLPLMGIFAYQGCSSDASTSDLDLNGPGQMASSRGEVGLANFNLAAAPTTVGFGGAQLPCTGAHCEGVVITETPDACDADTCRTPCMTSGVSCIADTDCCSAVCGIDGTCEPLGGRWRRARRGSLRANW